MKAGLYVVVIGYLIPDIGAQDFFQGSKLVGTVRSGVLGPNTIEQQFLHGGAFVGLVDISQNTLDFMMETLLQEIPGAAHT